MKFSKSRYLLGCLGIAALTTGCVDSAYDLSDIDTTTEIRVNDLTVPINMDAITLSEVIDVKEGESLKIVNGQYVVTVEGTFQSEPIDLNPIDISAPVINPTITTLNMRNPQSAMTRSNGNEIAYDIPNETTTFSYYYNDVDPSIKSIKSVKTKNYSLSINLDLSSLSGVVTDAVISQIRFRLPKGLTGTPSKGTYKSDTGILEINNLDITPAGYSITMPITAIEANQAGIVFNYKPTNSEFIFNGAIEIENGEILLDPAKVTASTGAPQSFGLRIDYAMSTLQVDAVTGRMQYTADDFVIPDVDLSNLPDFLRQEGTNILLNNPQIYLTLDNPLYSTNVKAQTGLTISAIRDGRPTNFCSLPQPVTIGTDRGNQPYYFCLAPTRPTMMEGFESAEYHEYPGLGRILEGNGLPTALHITTDNPGFPEQDVTDFPIGRNFGPIDGSYCFFAPLALDAGSKVIYTDSDDGWSSEDLDKLTIEKLTITALASSDIDAEIILSGNTLDKAGHAMANVQVSAVNVPANAKDYPIEIVVSGDIKDLDGFLYRMELNSEGPKTLTPDQYLKLTNIRATVCGKYVTDF